MSGYEQWAAIPHHPGYEASTLGNVRSIDRTVLLEDGRNRPLQGRLMRQKTVLKGYRHVSLNARWRPVHHVILETFISPRPDGLVCRHLNGIPSDNRLINLAWGTYGQNATDQVDHGTHPQSSKVACKFDHVLLEPNLTASHLRRGHRECRTCSLTRARVRDHASRGRHLEFSVVAAAIYSKIMDGVE